MIYVKTTLGLMVLSIAILSLPLATSAQKELGSTIRQLKSDSRDFAKSVDKDLDNSRYNGGHREDATNQLARDFRDAAARLEDHFHPRNINDSKPEAENVLDLGHRLDRDMRRLHLSPKVEGYWRNISAMLDDIARAYDHEWRERSRT